MLDWLRILDPILAQTLDHPVHGGSDSDDDETYTCSGDLCEFEGTLAQVMDHEDTCAQIIHTLVADVLSTDSEMSEAETETDQIE